MKTPQFNFKEHQNKRKDRKMLVRFVIYITVILFLIFFALNRKKTVVRNLDNGTIQQFEIEVEVDSIVH